MKVKVKRRHDRSFADSEKFVVNCDWDNPVWFSRAITRAKAEAMESMFKGGPSASVITSSETGEVLCMVSCNHDLSMTIINGPEFPPYFVRCNNG